ncbi:MAG: hypothetical protein AAF434_20260 [Pseudomonadota bacterium]
MTDSEIMLEHEEFSKLVSISRKREEKSTSRLVLNEINWFISNSEDLSKYQGYYFRYFYSFGYPQMITRSLVHISCRDGVYFWRNIEVLKDPQTKKRIGTNKYRGIVLFIADRINIIEYEALERTSITQVILYPCHRRSIDWLTGVQTGGPRRRGRKPSASALALEYLGTHVNVYTELRRVGLFHPDDADVPHRALELLQTEVTFGTHALEVSEP